MDKEQIADVPEKSAPKDNKGVVLDKKTLFVAAGVVFFLLLVGGAYFFGMKQKSSETESVLPTPALTSAVSVSPPVSPAVSPTPTPKPLATPTTAPTATPTITPTPTPETHTKTITSAASLDGFRSSNGGGNDGIEVRVGRNVNLTMRGFVSFDLGDIPSGAVVESATLRVYQYKIESDPYGVGSRVMVDHLDYGDSLENADYGASSISASFVTLTSNAVVEWKDAAVTDALKNDLSNDRSRSQYRLHFAIESIGGDVAGDFAYFESAENTGGSGNAPQLVVKYH